MDDTPSDKRKETKPNATLSKEKDPKDAKPAGRQRARSIWGRKKEK